MATKHFSFGELFNFDMFKMLIHNFRDHKSGIVCGTVFQFMK